jgi:phospholipid/cholesterol/gamma-HCH transport system substrate-binding protein
MENKSHALAAGTFVLLASVLLLTMAWWLMRDTDEQYQFELVTRQSVSGLQPQAAVRYKGVLVGRVQTLELDREVRGQIRIRIAVEKHTPVTTATFASLGYQGVTGLAFVQLDDHAQTGQALSAPTQGALPQIPMQTGLVTRLTEQGGNLLEKLDAVSSNVNTLLDPANQKILMGSIQEIGQAAKQMALLAQQTQGLLVQTEATLQSVQKMPEQIGSSFDAMRLSADEFRRVNTRMNAPNGTLDKMEQGAEAMQLTVQSIHSNLIPQMNRTAGNGAYAVRQLSRVADEVATNPHVLLWGKEPMAPGPGEKGFVAP